MACGGRSMASLLACVVVGMASFYLGHQIGAKKTSAVAAVSSGLLGLDSAAFTAEPQDCNCICPDCPPSEGSAVPAGGKSISVRKAMENTGTDKGPGKHHYDRYYEKWFAPFQNKPKVKILEIGADKGGSLHAWHNYFSDPEIILGLAYGVGSAGVEDRSKDWPKVAVIRGDQSKNETMQILIEKGPWDIVIEDGSHYPPHMVYNLFSLWKTVNPGGLFVVEDIETCYWKSGSKVYGYGLPGRGILNGPDFNAVAKFKQFIDTLSRWSTNQLNLSIMEGDEQICSIEFGNNLVAFKKCSQYEFENHPRVESHVIRQNWQDVNEWLREVKATNPKV